MIQVRITGWRHGLRKVSMTETIRDALGLGLAEAKGCTDRVLGGEVVVLDPPEWKTALALVRSLRELGAEAELGVGVAESRTSDIAHTVRTGTTALARAWPSTAGPRTGIAPCTWTAMSGIRTRTGSS